MSLTSLGRYDLCGLILSWMLGCALSHMFYARDENEGEEGETPLSSGRFLSTSFTLGSLTIFLFIEMFIDGESS